MTARDPSAADRGFADLSGRRAIVTGASSGIGRAIALELARGGAHVLVHCRASLSEADAVCAECRALAGSAEVIDCDFTADLDAPEFVTRAWQVWNGIDIWINNAGADLLTGAGAGLDYGKKLKRLYEVDVRATLLLAREAGYRCQGAGGGVILNIGWDQAERGMGGD